MMTATTYLVISDPIGRSGGEWGGVGRSRGRRTASSPEPCRASLRPPRLLGEGELVALLEQRGVQGLVEVAVGLGLGDAELEVVVVHEHHEVADRRPVVAFGGPQHLLDV